MFCLLSCYFPVGVRDSVHGMLEFVFNLISWSGLVLVALRFVTRSDLCNSLGSLRLFSLADSCMLPLLCTALSFPSLLLIHRHRLCLMSLYLSLFTINTGCCPKRQSPGTRVCVDVFDFKSNHDSRGSRWPIPPSSPSSKWNRLFL